MTIVTKYIINIYYINESITYRDINIRRNINMLIRDVIKDFIRYMESIDRSKETINGYEKELSYWNNYLSKQHNSLVYLKDLKLKEDLEDYMSYLKSKGNKSASRSRVVYILRSFFDYCVRNDLCDKNLGQLLVPVKIKQEEPEYLTEEEFEEFIEKVDQKIIRTVIETIFYSGLRISEVLNLTQEDVDMKNRKIFVVSGKGDKDNTVPMCDKLHTILLNYIENIRPKIEGNRFFCTAKTGSLSAPYVNRAIRIATEELGWHDRRISAHTFRHSFCSNLLVKGAPLQSVQKLLNHSNLSITSRYVHQNMSELEDAVNLL